MAPKHALPLSAIDEFTDDLAAVLSARPGGHLLAKRLAARLQILVSENQRLAEATLRTRRAE